MNKRISDNHRRKELIQAQVVSGLSVERFCRVKKICKTSFYAWRKHFRIAKELVAPALPSAVIPNKNALKRNLPDGFMRIIPPLIETTSLCLETPNGYKITVGYVVKDGLKDLLGVLRSL